MSADESPAAIVARFLRANHYEKTLDAFLEEANLPPDAGSLFPGAWTVEQILREKLAYDASLAYEKVDAGKAVGWSKPAPTVPHVAPLPNPANVLLVQMQPKVSDSIHTSLRQEAHASSTDREAIVVSTATRSLYTFDIASNITFRTQFRPTDSPTLSWTPIEGTHLAVGTSMSGQIVLWDDIREEVVDERRNHKKYVVKAAVTSAPDSQKEEKLLATAGWDNRIFLYTVDPDSSSIEGPEAQLDLPSVPEDIAWHHDPTSNQAILLVARRDSTLLHFWLPQLPRDGKAGQFLPLGSQNLSPHSAAWTTFSPCCLAACPNDSTLLAVATSSLPHLRVLVVKIMVPTEKSSYSTHSSILDYQASAQASNPAAAALARAELAQQDAFAAAIQLHVNTQAPQTAYSTPRCAWRPDGSGIWVNGDDGCVRGVEVKTGKVVCKLGPGEGEGVDTKGGHEAGSKIRDIWAGRIGDEEVVVSGGFDRRVVVWRVS